MLEFSNLKEMPKALATLQLNIKNPNRNKKAYNYYYADMDEVLRCIKEPCSNHDFSIIQTPYNDGDILGVETMLIHSSGEYIMAKFGSKLTKQDPQSVGSQISYYRRYSLLAMFNLSQEDDDGAAASGSQKQSNGNPASDKAKGLLANLMTKNGLVVDEFKSGLQGLTSRRCSALIETLKSGDIQSFCDMVK